MFHPLVQTWLARRFGAPTPAQARAWPLIAEGKDVLVTAPTGSGKTLAAFLSTLDGLVSDAIAAGGKLPARTRVVYVSPLKALSNDIRRNLEEPLAELRALAPELGFVPPEVTTAVRTGDTTAAERREAVKRPPHVLVTTPESLYILLTSDSGRKALRDVRAVIVDEIHAVAADKRGAHLSLSLERLDALVSARGTKLQRIGLSATVRPMDVAARLLVGARPDPAIVDVGQRRDLDLQVVTLDDELGAVATNEQWAEVYDRVADLARAHRSTIVFVNTRRLVERMTLHLGERLGVDTVAAHHGSLSRERRHKAETRLKAGDLKLVVATASLELGIDVGAVDLVCLIGSPRSIAAGLQRIGRSGHQIGATPKGRFFPLTRDQLVETAALVRAARRAEIDRIKLRDAPLDILAQQIVATCSNDEWDEDALFELVTRAGPYAALERAEYDTVVDVLSEGISTSRGRAGALLHRDGVNKKLRGRRGARLAAITSGGAIPDLATYDVVLEPDGTIIGSLDEDYAIESMAGDIFLLGNSSWKIRRVEAGRVRVEDAGGAPPNIPFWLGEGPARTKELSAEVSALREEVSVAAARGEDCVPALMRGSALDRRGAELLRDYLLAGRAALGAVPTQTRVIAERFFDESGGMQLVVHAPFGGRINRAWGMALRKSFCRTFDFELQAAATDDGIILSLGTQHSFPLESIFELVRAENLTELLTQAAIQAPMFETRWRWNAMRSLALPRTRGGKRVPPQLQRMKAQDLVTAVFPAQTACQDNHGGGAIEVPDHPLVKETIRDCLVEAMDAAGLEVVIAALRRGEIETVARDLPEPSVFSHEIINANPYAFLDDAPLEERRTRAVQLRRGLPAEVTERVGGYDAAVIAEVVAEAQPEARDPDELHDLLLETGALPEVDGRARGWDERFEALVATRRAARLVLADRTHWVAAERRALAAAVWPAATFVPDVVEPPARREPAWMALGAEGALVEIVRARLAFAGVTTAARLAAQLGVAASDVEAALARVEMEGAVLRGHWIWGPSEGPQAPRLTPLGEAELRSELELQWCDRRLLARINRRVLDGLRREIEPVSAADLMRFFLSWQHVKPGAQLHGRPGVQQVVAQLQGFESAAGAWEREILPARVAAYDSSLLDALCLSGEVAWGRLASRDAGGRPNKAAPIALARRQDLSWLRVPYDANATPTVDPETGEVTDGPTLSAPARDVLAFLEEHGASFLDEIVGGAGRLRAEVEDALWELVSGGRVTGDGFAGLRALISATQSRGSARARWHARWNRRGGGPVGAGRWSILRAPAATDEHRTEELARQYVRRYGVVFRDVLAREPHAPAWRDLLRVYRRLEMSGELRGGRFVAGFVGEQFAAPEAVEALRAARKEPRKGEVVRLSACDPLNLVGIITPGPRVPATLTNTVVFVDGVPQTEAAFEAPAPRVAPWAVTPALPD
ncbi:MAG TPA: DEAD/DEAH box helicase [Polyangia bacterium]|nr:DEAD/DEAH box helicase [Polyangia bacterium]HVZ73864.1 DEAD/DEAH box helicase [Polyangia bacterium]